MAEAEGIGGTAPAQISALRLLQIWLSLGVQSFGGGTATLFMIRRAAVEEHGWITEEEFIRDWAISQAAPGINLLCLTVLIGNRLHGPLGVLLALAGLLLPSVAITALLTGVYASIRDLEAVQSALRGVVPATAGLGLLMSAQMLRPSLAVSKREGRGSLVLTVVVVIGTALLVGVAKLPVIAALIGAGTTGALAGWWRARRAAEVAA